MALRPLGLIAPTFCRREAQTAIYLFRFVTLSPLALEVLNHGRESAGSVRDCTTIKLPMRLGSDRVDPTSRQVPYEMRLLEQKRRSRRQGW
jgi:hypothetical protein